MRWYNADLHIHTVLSPCGGLDMSPVNIVKQALKKKLDLIGITDHNSTRHCRLTQEIGAKYGITVLAGIELNTKEEIHCLAFFENADKAEIFQHYVNVHLNRIPNKPAIFGNQYIVDEQENILEEETWLLVASLTRGIGEVEKEIHSLGGICIPAHINRLHYGLYSQIGFLPEDLTVDALEISMTGDPEAFMKEHPEIKRHTLIASSDAHSLDKIGTRITEFFMEDRDLGEISQALQQINGRRTKYK